MTTPVKVVVDCSTGEQSIVPLTQAEIDQMNKDQADALTRQEAQAAAEAQRTADLAAVKAKAATDPAFAALARLLGA